MERDNRSYDDAKAAYDDGYTQAQELMETGDMDGIENVLMVEFNLEPDYLFDLIDELEY
jgi:hypothetical protein|tara:strand:+ start:1872 stop:2048 length:177 start_codon:yes stop_codon:yes gene_type:complete